MGFKRSGGSGLPPFSGVDKAVVTETPANGPAVFQKLTLDDIAPGVSITSFTYPSTNPVEIGTTITNPTFAATYSATPSSVTIADSDGGGPQAVSSPFTSPQKTGSYAKTANNAQVIYTLTAIINGVTKTSTRAVQWQAPVYWGAATPPGGAYDEAFVKALPSNALAATRNRTLSVTVGAGERSYYAIPSSHGTPTFTTFGLPGGYTLVDTLDVTHNGVTQPYDIWASSSMGIGPIASVVT
jgi:hypothetical protein